MTRRIHRRAMLRGLLGGSLVTIGLPFLEMFARPRLARAAPDSQPKRFGLFFWGNGVLPPLFRPTGLGATPDKWTLSPTLAPLAAHQAKLSVVSGGMVKIPNLVPHGSGPIGLFTGGPAPQAQPSAFPAATIDQLIADEIGGSTAFPSIEVGVQPKIEGLSYAGAGKPNPAVTSPAKLFKDLFVEDFTPPGTDPKPDPTLPFRSSVLDAVKSDVTKLESALGAPDRVRLEAHLDGLRDIEKRIAQAREKPPVIKACTVPAAPKDNYPDVDGRPPLSEISRIMADLTAMALACQRTHVFSFWLTQPVSNTLFKGAPSGHHQLTHDEQDPQPEVAKILLQIMDEFAYLLSALDKIPEGDGTLLDHCVILGTSDCNLGRQHTLDNYPIVLAGSCNGALKTGQHVDLLGDTTNKVMLTILQALDIDAASFGHGGYETKDSIGSLKT